MSRSAKSIQVAEIPAMFQPCKGVFQVCYQLLGVIEIILKVDFDHSEESHAREEGVRPRLKSGRILSVRFVHDEIYNLILVSKAVEGR